MAKKNEPVVAAIEAANDPIAQDIPMLELPNVKIPIAELPADIKEMVEIYSSWSAGMKKAADTVAQAEKDLVTLRRNAFLFEAGMKSLGEEIVKRVEAMPKPQNDDVISVPDIDPA